MPLGERTVSAGYLQALRTPLLAGSWCPELRLDFRSPPKAMVNRHFVDVYAHGADVVGRHVLMLDWSNPPPSWTLNARRQEIGIWIAMGAAPARIAGSLLAGACGLVAVGIAGGIAEVLAARPALVSLVFGIGSADAPTIAVGALVLSGAALLAASGPALKAARIDPVEAPRAE
ncbi:MAG TPA: hypothetical protein VKV17_12450 [Bryobacteraceae bacterium]|nr:hypothetical protein [Bryobacteraceae bacterium]